MNAGFDSYNFKHLLDTFISGFRAFFYRCGHLDRIEGRESLPAVTSVTNEPVPDEKSYVDRKP